MKKRVLLGKFRDEYNGYEYFYGYVGLFDEDNPDNGYRPLKDSRIKLSKPAYEQLEIFSCLDAVLFDKKGRVVMW